MNTVLKLTLGVASLAALANGQTLGILGHSTIATWSVQTNTPQWNHELGVTYTRQGCSDTPANCLTFAGGVALSDNVKVTLAIPLDRTTTTQAALEYSQLSQGAPFLAEISIDDFVDQYRALGLIPTPPSTVLSAVIANLKSANPSLKFGATIYEDELSSPTLQNASLPAALRSRFDYIHLFIHYRKDGPHYTTFVQQAHQIFPNARIVAGSYAYDRRAYLPCAPGTLQAHCTTLQDIDLFLQSLQIQVQLMNHGAVDRIEFYPGYFGTEEQWTGWSDPRECAPGDLAECIANTKTMRQEALAVLGKTPPPPVWTVLSPAGPLPVARYGQSAAMDSANDRMMVFGGTSLSNDLNDTWILSHADGQGGQPAWIPVSTAVQPPTGWYSNGMYDPAGNRMMIYGGPGGSDVWVLTDANGLGGTPPSWMQLFPTGNLPPVLTDYQQQVYDPINNVMIVYDSTAGVWTLSHANGLGGAPQWKQLNVPAGAGPQARGGFTAVYNPGSNRMIVFGGSDGTTDYNDIWVLTNANGLSGLPSWIPLPLGTAAAPAGREGHTAVYDPASDAMTIFGGIGQPADTWTASNASGLTEPPVWTLVNSGIPVLDPRTSCTAVLDTNTYTMIVFGGYNTDMLNSVMVLSSPLM